MKFYILTAEPYHENSKIVAGFTEWQAAVDFLVNDVDESLGDDYYGVEQFEVFEIDTDCMMVTKRIAATETQWSGMEPFDPPRTKSGWHICIVDSVINEWAVQPTE